MTYDPSTQSALGIGLRVLAVGAMLAGAVRAWKRHRASTGERRFLAVLTVVVVVIVAGTLLWAFLADGGHA